MIFPLFCTHSSSPSFLSHGQEVWRCSSYLEIQVTSMRKIQQVATVFLNFCCRKNVLQASQTQQNQRDLRIFPFLPLQFPNFGKWHHHPSCYYCQKLWSYPWPIPHSQVTTVLPNISQQAPHIHFFSCVKIHWTEFTILMCQFDGIRTFTMLCKHHHYLVLEYFYHLKIKPRAH